MHYWQLLAIVMLGTFAAVSTIAAAGVVWRWPSLGAACSALPAARRARRLLVLRVTPVLAGVCACLVSLVAFLRHEPRGTAEPAGSILLAAASVGMCLVLLSVWRVAGRCWATGRFVRTVDRSATRVTLPDVPIPTWEVNVAFPLVALIGVWRPRLLIARTVIDQVPGTELRVVLRHELAHARRRDNVVRLLLTALPDVLSLAASRLALERAWREAAEDVADEVATEGDTDARLSLAGALVRVAKMGVRHAVPAAPLLAFHEGQSVDRRVRRLLGPSPDPAVDAPLVARRIAAAVLMLTAGWWLAGDVTSRTVHHATEWLVHAGR